MRIGVAREIKPDEYRVALTPAGALELINNGHEVAVETGAGLGSSFPDEAYQRVGVQITSVDDVWEGSDLLLKVKEPIAVEYKRIRDGQILFTYLHIAADEPLTRALIDSGVTAVAYETVEQGGGLPLLAPMSEVAGRLAPQAGAYFLEKPLGGRGLLLGGVPGVAPGKVVIIGGGVVGYNAAVIALGLGAQVTILDRSIDRMRHLEEVLSGRVTLLMSSRLQVAACGRRRRDRPGWLLRDFTRDNPRRPGLRRRRRHALLRGEHARRGAGHLDQGADERNAAVRRGDRKQGTARGGRSRSGACARRERDRRQGDVRSRRRGARARLHAPRGRPPALRRLAA